MAIRVLGITSGKRKEQKVSWGSNEEVQNMIRRKKLAKEKWDVRRDDESRNKRNQNGEKETSGEGQRGSIYAQSF